MSRTNRLFQLMQSLRDLAPPVTAELLADALAVSPRTIYRDIDSLRGLGAVIDGAAGYGFTLIEDPALPPMNFDDEEIEALVLGLREVKATGDPALAAAAHKALNKIHARLPARQGHRLRNAVLRVALRPSAPAPGIDVRKLRRATWEELEVGFCYSDAANTVTKRQVRPLAIVFFQASHCLLAWCLMRQDFRAFRLDRMSGLTVSTQGFRPHRVALLRDYLAQLAPDCLALADRRQPPDEALPAGARTR